MVYFTASMMGPPEHFAGHIDINIDAVIAKQPLASVGLHADVGTARLHAPKYVDVRKC